MVDEGSARIFDASSYAVKRSYATGSVGVSAAGCVVETAVSWALCRVPTFGRPESVRAAMCYAAELAKERVLSLER